MTRSPVVELGKATVGESFSQASNKYNAENARKGIKQRNKEEQRKWVASLLTRMGHVMVQRNQQGNGHAHPLFQ